VIGKEKLMPNKTKKRNKHDEVMTQEEFWAEFERGCATTAALADPVHPWYRRHRWICKSLNGMKYGWKGLDPVERRRYNDRANRLFELLQRVKRKALQVYAGGKAPRAVQNAV